MRVRRRLWEIPPTSFVGQVLRAPLGLIPSKAVFRVRSGVNRGFRWVVGSSVHGCWLGHYEQDKQDTIVKYLEPGMQVLDVGANAGFYTLAAARQVGASGRVWAFEPCPTNVQNLLRHVELNELANVTVVQAAVAAGSGVAGFSLADNNSMGHISEHSNYLVPTISIDEFCRERGIDAPHLMKIDVEGAESLALRGATTTLSAGRTTIFLALHGEAQERDCLTLLEELDYRLVYLDGQVASERPLRSDEIIALPRTVWRQRMKSVA